MQSIRSLCLTASPFVGEDITLHALAVREHMPRGQLHRIGGVQAYFFAYFHQSVTITLDGVATPYPAGTLIIWGPGDIQEYGCSHLPWTQSYFECSGPLIRAAITEFRLPLRLPIICPLSSPVEQYLDTLAHEMTHRQMPDPAILRNIIENLLRELSYLVHDEAGRQEIPARLVEARDYLEAHYADPVTMPALAQHIRISTSQLRSAFKHYFHMPPMEYLISVRMYRACRYLGDPNLPIAEIAARVGYQDQNYFSLAFKKRYGMSPLAWRRFSGSSAAAERQHEELLLREFQHLLREGWTLATETDFTRDAVLDGRWQTYWHETTPLGHAEIHLAPELVQVADGRCRVLPIAHWVCLRWENDLTEETRWELTVANPHPMGINLSLSLSGDLQTGYRLRIFRSSSITLETVADGQFEILMQGEAPLTPAPEYHISFWRSGGMFIAEINGQRVLTYHAPLPPTGPRHRTCALGRYELDGELTLLRLQVLTRQAPRFLDILEPGRTMLRHGHVHDAAVWFADILRTHQEPDIVREAHYLTAFAISTEDAAGKEAALRLIADDRENPFRIHAWRDLGALRVQAHDLPGAIDVAYQIAQLVPRHPASQQIADQCVEAMRTRAPEQNTALLSHLGQLPLARLDLDGLLLTTVSPLRNMPLHELKARNNLLTDLSPLASMPLHKLDITHNDVADLTPLHGIPLHDLSCSGNHIHDLSPLRGMDLKALVCWFNEIEDISPLQGMSLDSLDCAANRIETLTPVAGMPLRALRCSSNRIHDLSPLRGVPLQTLFIGDNTITDLRPLRTLPLMTLDISGVPLDAWNCRLIADLPLVRFMHSSHNADAWALLADLPLLQYVNGHTIAHVNAIAATLARILAVWQQGVNISTSLHPSLALRPFAHETEDGAYLVVPLPLTRTETEDFCAWQGGRLACPDTPERWQSLIAYLLTIAEKGRHPSYHIGLRDANPAYAFWASHQDHDIAQKTGCACIRFAEQTGEWRWWGEPRREAMHYVVLEWSCTPARV